MKVLVTGGAGFIGSNVVRKYLDHGHEVFVIDDLSQNEESNLIEGVPFYRVSVCDRSIASIFRYVRPEIVNHHAAQVSVGKSAICPSIDAQTNIIGTVNLLESCVTTGVKKIIFASSGGAVYGHSKFIPTSEASPAVPISPYGLAKHTSERYIDYFSKCHGISYTILRYANVYGPRQRRKSQRNAVQVFFDHLMANTTPTIFVPNGSNCTRDYVYIEDVVEANLAVLNDKSNRIYNVGTGIETSSQELLQKSVAAAGRNEKVTPHYAELDRMDVVRSVLDCSLILSSIGWSARTFLDDGLRITWRWANAEANP